MDTKLIDEFLSEGTSAPGTEAPGTTAPSTEAPIEPLEPIEPTEPTEPTEPKTKAPTTSAPAESSTEAPGTSAPDDDDAYALMQAQNEELLKRINELSTPKAPEAPAQPDQATTPTGSFLEGLEIPDDPEDLFQDRESFMRFLDSFAKQVYLKSVEGTLRSIPGVVTKFVSSHISLRDATQEFYQQNEDLARVKPYVAQVASQVAAEHPDWTVQGVFEETSKRVREALKLRKSAQPQRPPKAKLKGPGGGRGADQKSGGTAPTLDGLAKDINDLISE